MNIILFDPSIQHTRFYPLTFSRPISQLRVGILTIAEKWSKIAGTKISYLTVPYLQKKYQARIETENLLINGTLLPDEQLFSQIKSLKNNQALFFEGHLLACRTNNQSMSFPVEKGEMKNIKKIQYQGQVDRIEKPSDIFVRNGQEITRDIHLIKPEGNYQTGDQFSMVYAEKNVFIGKNTSIKSSILDAESGPVFIDDEVTLQPGTIIGGPAAILKGSIVSMGAKIRPNTTLGPYCKIGGEVSNVVFQGYSNKSHDGFLGTSVIGEWCNFGAGTNNSNLKNNYSEIKVWDYAEDKMVSTGLQYYGLIMGDHSKCGINTMFNTGTVIGFSANIYDGGYMPKFIPSFAWGNRHNLTVYELDKAMITARRVMERRSVTMTQEDDDIFEYIFKITSKQRLP
jgi:UDP-N-acetylglucosamine diphosphorylase/glucosamine-1-phosphate N-acetyltransferase